LGQDGPPEPVSKLMRHECLTAAGTEAPLVLCGASAQARHQSFPSQLFSCFQQEVQLKPFRKEIELRFVIILAIGQFSNEDRLTDKE
jgi:hypothetical protein